MIDLRLGDCLDILPMLEAQSIDAIITDLPYGTTACKWDVIIPFEPMWAQVKRLLRPHGAFVTTANQPFTSVLIMSNPKLYRYRWVWIKDRATGYLDVSWKPLQAIEDIVIFCDGKSKYNPIMRDGSPISGGIGDNPSIYHDHKRRPSRRMSNNRYPLNCIEIPVIQGKSHHPTQKPIALYEYLIRTYTNEGDTVLDFCMGSGTTGVACVKLNRNFIGCELDPDYFEIAKRRIEEAQMQIELSLKVNA